MTGTDAELRSEALSVLQARGFLEQATDWSALDKALDSGMVTFYVGYDPTASSLHVGNLVTMMAVRHLQRAGHRPIILVGGGTARVGDPSGKQEMRKVLDEATIDSNTAALREQLARVIHFDRGVPHDAVMVDNADWLLRLNYLEFLRTTGVHFTVNRMIAAKTYRDRLEAEQPLSFLEFNYQLLQAYDFQRLYDEHSCKLQVGGADQWGNMVAGVELIRRHLGGQDAHCLTFPLLTTADGRKMGKTERGAVWLDPARYSEFDYFQFWINSDDRDVRRLLMTFTELDVTEVEALTVEPFDPRKAKAALAFHATALLHGKEAAVRCEQASKQAFGAGDDWSALTAIEFPAPDVGLLDALVDPRIAAFKSKREARQRIEAGAVRINGDPCTDPSRRLSAADAEASGIRLQAGKKHRFRLVIED